MAATILLVVKSPERTERYLGMMNDHDAACCVVSSLQEAITHASEEPHCGILIDMFLMVKIPALLKTDVDGLLNDLPSATLNIHRSNGDIRMLPRGAMVSGCSSIDQFVKACAGFSPKIIFSRKRESLHINALMDIAPEFKTPDRTVCIDVSTGGCFLFCVREDIAAGSTVWIKLPGVKEDLPIKGVVCWVREWGTTQKIPGIGINFIDASDEFKRKIGEMIR